MQEKEKAERRGRRRSAKRKGSKVERRKERMQRRERGEKRKEEKEDRVRKKKNKKMHNAKRRKRKNKRGIDAGAAMKRSLLKMLKPELVIVEEAAECLEAQVLSSLPSSTKQLVLIGDHLQLRWAFSLVLSLSLSCVGVPLPVPSQPRHLTGHLAPATSTFASTR